MWRQAINHSVIILMGILISRFFVFLYRILLVRELEVQHYAQFVLYYTIFIWIFVFCHFNFHAAVSKFVAEKRAQNKQSENWNYYLHAVVLGLCLSVIGIIVGVITSPKSQISLIPDCVFFTGLLPFTVTQINYGLLNGYGKYLHSSLISSFIGTSRFCVPFLYFLAFKTINIDEILVFFGLSLWIPFVVSQLSVRKLKNNILPNLDLSFSLNLFKAIFNYAKWITLTDLLNTGCILFNTLLLSFYSNKDLAIFNVALIIFSIFQMCFGAITTVLIPQTSYRSAQGAKIQHLGPKEQCLIFLIGMVSALAIWLIPNKTEFAILLFHRPIYGEAINYIPLFLLLFPFKTVSVINKGIVQGLGFTRPNALIALLIFVLNAALFTLFYIKLGLAGAISSTVLSAIIEYLFSQRIVLYYLSK